METIKLDLIPGKKMPSLHASQYDDGREHGIDLFENGVVYKLDGTETLTINERKGDDCICSLDIENTFADTNHIEFASTEQMCAVWGNNICELVIAKGEKTIGTLNFILEVEPSPTENGIKSESEIKNLTRQIEEITEEVIGDDYYTAEQTDEAIANATEDKADTTYVDEELAKKADKTDTYTKTQIDSALSEKANASDVYTKTQTYSKSEVDTLIDNLPEPMIFKGTLGVGGTIQSLPTASAINEGFTYKVITDGTYAGQTAKVGDVFTSNGSAWVLIPSGDEDTDTWRAIKVNGVEKLGNGISSGSVDFEDTTNVKFEFDANGNKVRAKLDGIYTESEVDDLLDDKADKSDTYTKAQVDDIVYNILPDDTASGSVANFTTSLELPIKSLEVDVNAVQESGTPTPSSSKAISGWNSVKVGLTSDKASYFKGLLSGTYGFVDLGSLTWGSASNSRATCGNLPSDIKLAPSGSVKGNILCAIYTTDTQNNVYNRTTDKTIAVTNNTTAKLMVYDSDLGNKTNTEVINALNGVYLIYELDVAVTPTITPEQFATLCTKFGIIGTETVIPLGQTVYGGHFTQDKAGHRQFEVTYKRDLLKNWTWTRNNTEYAFAYFSTTNVTDKANNKNFVCEIFANNNNYRANLSNGEIGVYNNTTGLRRFCIRCDEATTPEEFNTIIGDYAIIYELATPYVIDLPDGEPIITLNGTNNIYADTGDCAVEYKCSVAEYVANHSGGGGAKSLGGVFLGGSNSGSEEEPTEESEETEKVKELDEPKEEIKTIGEKKIGGE